jgi:hypothetical protein
MLGQGGDDMRLADTRAATENATACPTATHAPELAQRR